MMEKKGNQEKRRPDYGWRFQGKTIGLCEDRSVLVDESTHVMERALRQMSMEYFVLDRCLQCGICTESCPHTQLKTDSRFSPRSFIQKARLGLLDLSEEDLWLCTQCGQCKRICPYEIPFLDVMISLRNLVVEQGAGYVPAPIKSVLSSLSTAGNPWKEDQSQRGKWYSDMHLSASPPESPDGVMLFVGCLTSFDKRAQKIARAAAMLLNRAGVAFDILGDAEVCCGDSAFRAGDKGTFERLKEINTKNLVERGAKRIYTLSPHCFDVMKNQYKGLEENGCQVVPLVILVNELIQKGSLPVRNGVAKRVAFHDPCFFSKHHQIVSEPREILQHIPGIELVEMEHHGEKSLCCGGGGGGIWRDTVKGERLAEIRLDEALKVDAEILATACPYCLAMLEESARGEEKYQNLKVMDICELLMEGVFS